MPPAENARSGAGGSPSLPSLLATLEDVVWARDLGDHSLIFMNEAAERVYGRPVAQFFEQPQLFLEVVHPEDRPAVRAAEAEFAPDRSWDLEYRILRPDGSVRWIHDRGSVASVGDRPCMVGIASDVTERRELARGLTESEARLRILGSIALGIRHRDAVDDIVGRAVAQLGEAFPSYRTSYATIGPDGELAVLHSVAPQGLQPLAGMRVNLGHVPNYLKPLLAGETRATPDLGCAEGLGDLREALVAGGAGSMLDVPLRHSQDQVGLLCVCAPKPHEWSPFEVRTLQEAASFLALAIEDARGRADKARALEELCESERMRAELMRVLPGMAYRGLPDDRWTMTIASEGARELTGHAPSDFLPGGKLAFSSLIDPEDRAPLAGRRRAALASGKPFRAEFRIRAADGSVKWVWDQCRGVFEKGELVAVEGFLADLTDRKRLELELFQAQKMESIGRLAGGIAHDYSNLLTAVLGYAELARGNANDPRAILHYLDLVTEAAQRANSLTQQLLSFARRQIVEPAVLPVDELLLRLAPLLRRLVRENIELVVLAPGRAGSVRADRSQLEEVIVNLVANARDAMPEGGKLTVEADAIELGEEEAKRKGGLAPGEYVRLRVSDTGDGIDPGAEPFVFEPFFTTKQGGKGLGLGLATCFGIVSRHGGHISFRSEAGRGTTFEVLLPRVGDGPSPRASEAAATAPQQGGRETILVVEDEPLVRDMAAEALRSRGYEVLVAENGAHALQIVRGHFGPIDLLVTDLVMPQIGGSELADLLEKARPGMRVLYTSGYTESFDVPKTLRAIGGSFLRKPYTPTVLAQKVRQVLD